MERGKRKDEDEGDGEVDTQSVDQHTPARELNLAFLKNETDLPTRSLSLEIA